MRIVGISPSHDSSVCVYNDGEIEYFFKEERLCGIKKESKPYLAMIEAQKTLMGPVDLCVIASPDGRSIFSVDLLAERLFKCPVIDMDEYHHMSHAALAFENSGFDEALIFVADRNGSKIGGVCRESETVMVARRDPYTFTEIYKNYWSDYSSHQIQEVLEYLKQVRPETKHIVRSKFNATMVYESATTLIGEHPLENGKTMGLSAYGHPEGFPDLFVNCLDSDVFLVPHDSYFDLDNYARSHVKPVMNRELNEYATNEVTFEDTLHADYAKHVQNQTQEEVFKCIDYYSTKTGIKNIIVTGGYGMNIVTNSYLVQLMPECKFWFEPIADDTGNSIGACIYSYKNETGDTNKYPLKDTFFHGYDYDLEDVYFSMKEGSDWQYDTSGVADLLDNDKSVAVYYGKAEAGQRALGNRSILFNAFNPSAKDIVNEIKKREWYRPFAAIILEEDAKTCFDMLYLERNEFMTNSFQIKEEWRLTFQGIVHEDGSCRIQTVREGHLLYELLTEIKSRRGIGILLNTSFNLAGEPLVETPDEALRTLHGSNLDYVWFPSYNLVAK